MNSSIAMLAMFTLRLAVPFVILFIVGEWCSRRANAAPHSPKS